MRVDDRKGSTSKVDTCQVRRIQVNDRGACRNTAAGHTCGITVDVDIAAGVGGDGTMKCIVAGGGNYSSSASCYAVNDAKSLGTWMSVISTVATDPVVVIGVLPASKTDATISTVDGAKPIAATVHGSVYLALLPSKPVEFKVSYAG